MYSAFEHHCVVEIFTLKEIKYYYYYYITVIEVSNVRTYMYHFFCTSSYY
jgi:hypothetical protein